MAEWPGVTLNVVPAAEAADPTWPSRVEVGPLVLVGPTGANRQPSTLDIRTETLRAQINTLVELWNTVRDFFLDVDGANAAPAGSSQAPVFMRGALGLGGNRITGLADGIADTDAVTVQQLESIQFSAEDDVEQVVDTLVVFVDGSAPMTSTLDLGGNRLINLGEAAAPSDLERKSAVDTSFSTLQTALLRLNGSQAMTGDLNMDGPVVTDPGFRITNLATPVSGGDLVNKGFLDDQAAILGVQDVPVGAVVPFMGPANQIPENFLLCDGREVSRFTFANLFNIIGIAYGVPGSSSVFRLPDLRGRVLVGLDNMGGQPASRITQPFASVLGGKGGISAHPLTVAEMASHTHDYDDITYAGGVGSEQGDDGGSDTDNQLASTVRITGSTGLGGPHNNVQPTLTANWIIRF